MTAAAFTRASRRNACPVCDHMDWCRWFPDGGVECMRVGSDIDTRNGGWMHWPGGRPDDWRERLAAMPPPPPRPELDMPLLDRAYRALLDACPLSDAAITRHGYATLPDKAGARRDVARAVAQACGPVSGIVPGFDSDTIAAAAGEHLLTPFRDIEGRIAGIQLRVANAPTGKYRWLSGGSGVGIDGNTVHHAQPRRRRRADVVWVTEGPRKANVAADRLGHPVLAVAGIGNTAHVADAIAAYPDARYVVVAFDQESDADKRRIVAAAEQRLVSRIADAHPGVTILQAVWAADDGKGLDDVLLAGLTPITLPHPAMQAAPVAAPAEVAALREEARLITKLVAKNNLGGDVGGTVALRIVNYASAVATSQELEPGDVVPLVASKIAAEFWDDDKGQNIEAVSRQTVSKYVDKFADHAVILTMPVDYTYTTKFRDKHGEERTIEKTTKVPGLVWPEGGRQALLAHFVSGSVLEEGQERNRGGKREKRAIVCPSCASEAGVMCVACQKVYRSVEVTPTHVTLSGDLPDRITASSAPVEQSGDSGIAWPDDDTPGASAASSALLEQSDGDAPTIEDAPSGTRTYSGELRAVGRRPSQADRDEARSLWRTITGKGASLTIRRGRLVLTGEELLTERILGRYYELLPVLWDVVDTELALMGCEADDGADDGPATVQLDIEAAIA